MSDIAMIWKSENDLGREFAEISDNGGELQLECRSFRLESVIRAEAVSYIVEEDQWRKKFLRWHDFMIKGVKEIENGGSINVQGTELVYYPQESLADSQPPDPHIVSGYSFNAASISRCNIWNKYV